VRVTTASSDVEHMNSALRLEQEAAVGISSSGGGGGTNGALRVLPAASEGLDAARFGIARFGVAPAVCAGVGSAPAAFGSFGAAPSHSAGGFGAVPASSRVRASLEACPRRTCDLFRLIEHARPVFETHVMTKLTATDRGLFSWASTDCRAAVISCGLPRAGSSQQLPFKVEDFVSSIELLKWAESNGCPILDSRTHALAARGGHMEGLKYLRELGRSRRAFSWIPTAAGSSQQLPLKVEDFVSSIESLKWAESNGCPVLDSRTLALAARGGCLEVIKYLRELGCSWSDCCAPQAAAGGQLQTLKWLKANGCPWDIRCSNYDSSSLTAGLAAQHGHVEILIWLRENGVEFDSWTCSRAAEGNQLATLQWLRASGSPCDERTCTRAASHGHIAVLEYAIGQGITCGAWTCMDVAWHGNLDMLKWLRERDVVWDEDTLVVSAENGHHELFKWAKDNGCPVPSQPELDTSEDESEHVSESQSLESEVDSEHIESESESESQSELNSEYGDCD